MHSVFELFKVGIGPSSSHTLGPMKIAKNFLKQASHLNLLSECFHIRVELFGSLGATGKGHGSDRAFVSLL